MAASRRRLRWYQTGTFGWIITAAGIAAWDLAAPDGETLSERFRAGCRANPAAAITIGAGWSLVTLHLFEAIPKPLDPLHAIHLVRDRRRSAHQCRSSADRSADQSAHLTPRKTALTCG